MQCMQLVQKFFKTDVEKIVCLAAVIMNCNDKSGDGPVTKQTQQNETYQDMTASNKLTTAEREAVSH